MQKRETKRSLQAKATQKRIFAAALKLFEENGIESVTMGDIAEEAGCSPGNIYHYFKSKEEIAIKTLLPVDEKYSDFYERMQGEEPYLSMSPSELLAEFFCETVRVCVSDGQLQSAYVLALKNPGLKTLRMNESRAFHRICTALLQRMQQAGELNDRVSIEDGRDLVLVLLRGVLTEWIISGQEFDPLERAHITATILLEGLKSGTK